MNLALVDINEKNLLEAKEIFVNDNNDNNGTKTEIYVMDVSKIEEWKALKEKVEARFGGVDFLMLNAGIGLKGGWEEVEYFHKVW